MCHVSSFHWLKPSTRILVINGFCNTDNTNTKRMKHYKDNWIIKLLDHSLSHTTSLRAALHLEAGPIRCVRGLKSSLVIA
jgi:hypothetical protein